MVLSLMPMTAFAASDVPYIDKDGKAQTCDSAQDITSSTTI